jgi:hypothetical protein
VILALSACVMPGPFGGHPADPIALRTPEIAAIDLACKVDKDQWTLSVTASAWTGGGDTLWSEDGEYVEEHAVPVITSKEDGSEETLELDLAIVSDWRDQTPNVSTVFTCGDQPQVAFTLFDTAGDPVVCAFFTDPGDEPTDCPEGLR